MAMVFKDDDSTAFNDCDEEAVIAPIAKGSNTPNKDMRRAFMTAAVFFMSFPKFSPTLWLWLASLSIPPIVDVKEVVFETTRRLDTFVQLESDAYLSCTVDAFERRDQEMIQAVHQENEDLLERQAFNLELLQSIENTTNACTMDVRNLQQAAFHWNSVLDQPLPFLNATINSTCSRQDISYIETSLGEDFNELESEVTTILGDYRFQSETSLDLVRNYAKERSDYDYNYFLRNRIEPALELLGELTNKDLSVHFSLDPNELVEELRMMLQPLKDAYIDAIHRINQLTESAEIFYNAVLELQDLYERSQHRLYTIINATNPWLPRVTGYTGDLPFDYPKFDIDPAIFDVSAENFKLPQFTRPAFFTVGLPTFNSALPDIELLLEEFSKMAIARLQEVVETLAEEATDLLETTAKEILDEIRRQLSLDDYNPPQFQGSRPELKTLDAEAEFLSQVGDDAEANTRNSLKLAQGTEGLTNTAELPSDVPDVVDPIDSSFSENTTTFDYSNVKVPNFLKAVIQWVGRIIALFVTSHLNVFLELGFQTFRLIRLKFKWEKESKPDQPIVDLSGNSNATDGHDALWDKLLANLWLLAKRLLLNKGILAGAFVALLAYFVVHYNIVHVGPGCIESNYGTWLSEDLGVPFYVNRASTAGNALHLESEYNCFRKQRQHCEEMVASSELAYRDSLANLAGLEYRFNQSIQLSSRLERCLDTNVLDADFMDACCGLEGYGSECLLEPQMRAQQCPIDESGNPPAAFLPVGHYLGEPHCHADPSLWTLKDARFDCEVLQDSCVNIPCTGVDEDLITAMVVEADCQVHLAFLVSLSFFCAAAFHGCMFNIVIPFVISAVKLWYGEWGNPDGIKLESLMNKAGKILKGASEEERSAAIKAVVAKSKTKAKVQAAGAITICIAWGLITHYFFGESLQLHHN